MKKLFVLAAVAIAMHAAPVVAMDRPVIKQSPMVLVELQASMKADLVLAERKMGWEIQDELQTQYVNILNEELTITGIAKLTSESITDLNIKSED